MEGDTLTSFPSRKVRISTHALTWRATLQLNNGRYVEFISTHALTWRATTTTVISATLFLFLPTPSHGGRHELHHPRGLSQRNFYPRPHMEGDSAVIISITTMDDFYPRPHMEGDSKHAEVQACISAAYLKCSTRKAAASRRCADLGGKAVLFHQFPHLVLGRARCEPRGEGMCDRGSHRQSGRKWFKLTAIKCHPGSTEGPGRCVPPCFYSGCPADKSAGCPSGDRSAQ